MNVVQLSYRASRFSSGVVLMALTLSACTGLTDGPGINYKTEQPRAQPLEVPPDLNALPRDDRYVVPGAKGTASASAAAASAQGPNGSSAAPTAATTVVAVQGVRIERDGSQRWLAVDQPPEKLWSTVHDFWPANGFVYLVDDQQSGVLETDWAEGRGAPLPEGFFRRNISRALNALSDTGQRDRFRTRLTRTATGTEITITHRGIEEVLNGSKDSSTWQPRASDPELEAAFLQRLMVKLGTSDDAARAAATNSTSAISSPSTARAKIVTTPQGKQIELDETIDRAWRRVGLALDRIGFTVESRDRSTGYYTVRVVDPDRAENEQGFFSKLFGLQPDNVAQIERVSVKTEGGVVRVLVTQGETAPGTKAPTAQLTAETIERVTNLIYDELK
jgi:outer membrane protein assembly factor BamC